MWRAKIKQPDRERPGERAVVLDTNQPVRQQNYYINLARNRKHLLAAYNRVPPRLRFPCGAVNLVANRVIHAALQFKVRLIVPDFLLLITLYVGM